MHINAEHVHGMMQTCRQVVYEDKFGCQAARRTHARLRRPTSNGFRQLTVLQATGSWVRAWKLDSLILLSETSVILTIKTR